MLAKDFNHTTDLWIKSIEQNNFDQICAKPFPTSWSLGQVCMHLIEATHYYLEQANVCLSSNDHVLEEMTLNAKTMFRNNEFPDELIEGPPTNANTPQPASKDDLLLSLLKLKGEINRIAMLISISTSKGKTKHPGLHYFNAKEWFQFADMHLRHHLRQKNRIDEFLKNNS